jgi:hypothetical protein
LVFVFRQGVELGLKHLAKLLPEVVGRKDSIVFTPDLIDNWNLLKSLISELSEFDPQRTIPFINNIIGDIVKVDQPRRFLDIQNQNKRNHMSIILGTSMPSVSVCLWSWMNWRDFSAMMDQFRSATDSRGDANGGMPVRRLLWNFSGLRGMSLIGNIRQSCLKR